MARPRTVSAPLLAVSKSLTITEIVASTTTEIEFDVPGARMGHPVLAWVEDTSNPLDAAVVLTAAWCSSKDHITMRFAKVTAGNVTPGATVVKIVQL